jgi:hypothetical protein
MHPTDKHVAEMHVEAQSTIVVGLVGRERMASIRQNTVDLLKTRNKKLTIASNQLAISKLSASYQLAIS